MGKTHRVVATYFGVLIVALLLSHITPRDGLAGEPDRRPSGTAGRGAPFTLTIQDGLLSVSATDASIKQIVEELGRRMDIDVSARLPAEEKMTLAFERLPLMEAMKRFGRHVNYSCWKIGPTSRGRSPGLSCFPGERPPTS